MSKTSHPLTQFRKKDWKNTKTMDMVCQIIKENPTPALLNYQYFFKELGREFGGLKTSMFPLDKESRNFYLKNMKPKECHINAFKVSYVSNGTFDFIYGFVDSCIMNYNETAYAETYQHSFLLTKGDKPVLFDPTISYLNNQGRKFEILNVGRNYFGVHIPDKILDRAQRKVGKKKISNISHYLREYVFVSNLRTKRLVNEIRKLNSNALPA